MPVSNVAARSPLAIARQTQPVATPAATEKKSQTAPATVGQQGDRFERAGKTLDKTADVIDRANKVVDRTAEGLEKTNKLVRTLSSLVKTVQEFLGVFKK